MLGIAAAVIPLVKRVHDFAENVELELIRRRIADANGFRVLVAGKPGNDAFDEPALTRKAIDDLHLLGAARHRAAQPGAPLPRLVPVAGVHQRQEREGCVAQPAIAVVPVAKPPDLLRQRRGGGGGDAARRMIGEPLQGDERAQDRACIAAWAEAALGPAQPALLRLLQRLQGIDGRGRRRVGASIAQHEGDRLARPNREAAAVRVPACFQRRIRAQLDHVRPRNRLEALAVHARDPGDDQSVIEAQDEFGLHLDLAPKPLNEAHDAARAAQV